VISRVKSAASLRWAGLKERRPGLRHVVAAWKLLQDNNGSQYAAAITYFSFLALFPLLLLAVAVTGFVLHSHPAAQQSLLDHITANVPGDLGKTLKGSVRTAIKSRTGVGIVGLVGVLLTAFAWNFWSFACFNCITGLGIGGIGPVIVGTPDVIARAARTPDTGRRHSRLAERLAGRLAAAS